MTYLYAKTDFNCAECPRLKGFINGNREKFPCYFNGPVPSFGDESPELLVVGLAPGLHGANQNGIPFTGDYAGDLLYPTLLKYGWAEGRYKIAKGDNGLKLLKSRITNAVRCVPPQNKPVGEEINTCRPFLINELSNPSVKIILTLGTIAHNSVIKALGGKLSSYKFGHGNVHELGEKIIVNSYHCSRYNLNTRRLTAQMFDDVFDLIDKKVAKK